MLSGGLRFVSTWVRSVAILARGVVLKLLPLPRARGVRPQRSATHASALRRRQHRLRMFWGHEQLSLQTALADALHHSAQPMARNRARPPRLMPQRRPWSSSLLPAVFAALALVALVLSDFLMPVPIVQVVHVPQVHLTEKIVESPEIQSAQDTHISESLDPAPSRSVTFGGNYGKGGGESTSSCRTCLRCM